MSLSPSKRASESGNALWFILIGVVLLGALTMVLSRSGSSVDQSGDVEQRRVKASQIMRYARSIEAAVEQLRLKGCSENEISFENSVAADYTNARAPADNSCHVFEPEGAGLEYQDVSNNTIAGLVTSNTIFISDYIVGGIGSDSNQELLFAAGVSESLCTDINNQLGIDNTNISSNSDGVEEPWNGTFPAAAVWSIGTAVAAEAPALNGKKTGCFSTQNGGEYIFYHVLIAR